MLQTLLYSPRIASTNLLLNTSAVSISTHNTAKNPENQAPQAFPASGVETLALQNQAVLVRSGNKPTLRKNMTPSQLAASQQRQAEHQIQQEALKDLATLMGKVDAIQSGLEGCRNLTKQDLTNYSGTLESIRTAISNQYNAKLVGILWQSLQQALTKKNIKPQVWELIQEQTKKLR